MTLAYEPLGAAYWYARDLAREETVLVADFGGGTSDFSLIRFSRGSRGRLEATALGHGGVGVAGDTFDARLVDHLVAPRLGKGTRYRSIDKLLPLPAYPFAALSQWHQLSWLKTPATLRELRRFATTAEAPDRIADLVALIENDLGFELNRAIAQVKSRLSDHHDAELRFDRAGLTIEARATRADFEGWIAGDLAAMDAAMTRVLEGAGVTETEVDAVFMTGGTSYVPAVRALFTRRFDPARLHFGNAFQSVASGLALMAADEAAGVEGRLASSIAAH